MSAACHVMLTSGIDVCCFTVLQLPDSSTLFIVFSSKNLFCAITKIVELWSVRRISRTKCESQSICTAEQHRKKERMKITCSNVLSNVHYARLAAPLQALGRIRRSQIARRISCNADYEVNDTVKDASSKDISVSPSTGGGSGNAWLALGAVALAAGSLILVKAVYGGPALERLRATSLPLEVALVNGKPTVLEFYADWCEVCNELAPMTLQVLCRNLSCHPCMPPDSLQI